MSHVPDRPDDVGHGVEVDELLERGDGLFDLVLDTLDEGLIVYDAGGRVVRANERAAIVLGLRMSQLEGASSEPNGAMRAVRVDETPWPEEDWPAAVTLRTGETVSDQTMGLDRLDGTRVWLRVRSRPIHGHGGRVAGALAVFEDITAQLEQRSTEAALTERLRVAIDGSPLGTGLADRLGRLTYVNDSYARLLGIHPTEAVGRFAAEFSHPDDRLVGVDQLIELRDGRRDQAMAEARVLHSDGSIKRARVHVARLEPATARAAYLLQVEDISERHELETALQRSEELARVSLDALEQGVLLIGPDGSIRRMNPSAQRMLGYEVDELTEMWSTGQWVSFDEHGQQLAPEDRPLARAAATGETVRDQLVRWQHRDGTRILVRVTCLPTDIGDDGTGLVVVLTDVTVQRRLERKLERYGVLFNHSSDIIAVAAADGQLKFASPAHKRILGYPDDWPFPGGILGLVHPDDHDAAAARFGDVVDGDPRAQAAGGAEPITVRVRHASGEWRHFDCAGVNLLDDPVVDGVLLTFRDVTERQHLLHQLSHRATHDMLTDLPNRSVFVDRLGSALARVERTGEHIALCYLDLDGFKAINDTLGHAVGDRMLVAVAERLRGAIRAGDTPARIGGDEFVVILDPVHGVDEAVRAATRVRDAVLGDDDLTVEGIRCGVSIGVALNRHDDDHDSLSARADTALYEAKARGGRAIVLAPVVGQLT